MFCQIVRRIYPKTKTFGNKLIEKVFGLLNSLSEIVLSNPLAIVLALLGLGALMITGALGGAITYGPDADPIVSIVYKIFVK